MAGPRHTVGPAWPPPLDVYDYILTLSDAELAWEFLRRNPEYRRCFQMGRVGRARPRRLGSGQLLWRVAEPRAGAGHWGLQYFC